MTVVRLRGAYDASRHDELDEILDRYGDADPLTFDLVEVDRLDSGALRSLERFQRARKEAGRSPFVFTGVSPSLKMLLRDDLVETD